MPLPRTPHSLHGVLVPEPSTQALTTSVPCNWLQLTASHGDGLCRVHANGSPHQGSYRELSPVRTSLYQPVLAYSMRPRLLWSSLTGAITTPLRGTLKARCIPQPKRIEPRLTFCRDTVRLTAQKLHPSAQLASIYGHVVPQHLAVPMLLKKGL